MATREQASQARRRLDARLLGFRPVSQWSVPRKGWVRALRDALGMPAAELARRLGVSQPAVFSLERSEESGSIQLATLRRAAEALDCTLVYALVPNRGLEETVREQAERLVDEELRQLRQTMALEDQATPMSAEARNDMVERMIASRRLWSQP